MPLKVQESSSSSSTKHFIEFLIQKGAIKSGFRGVLRGRDLIETHSYLLEKNLIPKEQLYKYYGEFFNLPVGSLVNHPIRPEVAKLIPVDVAERYKVLAFELIGNSLSLAVGEPAFLQRNAPLALMNLRKDKGLRIGLVIVPEEEVIAAIKKVYDDHPSTPVVSSPLPKHEELPSAPAEHPIAPKSLNKQDLIQEVDPRKKSIDLRQVQIPLSTLNKLPFAVAKKYKIIVFESDQPRSQFEQPLIKVAAVSPGDLHVKEILTYIEQRNKVLIDQYETTEDSFNVALSLYPEATQVSQPKAAPKTDEVVVENEVEEKSSPAVDHISTPPTTTLPSTQPSAPKSPLPEAPTAVTSAPKVESHPAAPSTQAPAEGLALSAADIINRPSEESTADLKELAKQQEMSLEDQNLDKLLKQPITSVDDLAKSFRTGYIPEIVAATLFLAIRMKASDVHIEAGQDTVRLRFRIDGILHDVIKVPYFLHAPLISRIKILAKMKIDEQRIPQDGRFDVVIDNRQVDLRVSTLPTVHGEKIVMRLLDKSEGILTLEQLGVTGSNFDTLIANIRKPYGIILSTGPTGSGKSTTLYAILSRISKPGVNIITLEDPVEYELPGINQAQVKPGIGFTFAEGLRSVLRQDPNVIMVGEIRDLETAAMATHAALTGHLVLSTLHTNDSAGALPRLINMGVEPFLITSSINAVIGQRLVRKVCERCRERVEVPPAVKSYVKKQLEDVPSGQLKNLDLEQLIFYHGKGCPECTDGYKGRIGIFEVLPMSEKIEELAVKKAPSSDIKKAAVEAGMITMTQDGLIKALKGITTIDEVMRVTTADSKEVPGGS